MPIPSLIVHGGAGNIPSEHHQAYRDGCHKAAEVAWKLLQGGDTALHAVEVAVTILEDNPTYDAGIGSVLNRVGEIEMDALIMDGSTLDLGAVMAVKQIQNPIILARLVMEKTPHKVLAGAGANLFAAQMNIPLVDPSVLITPYEAARYERFRTGKNPLDDFEEVGGKGTVGAVARDQYGNIAAATSTGGVAYKMVGRVGDSPLVGAGTYADNLTGGASATGHGEQIMRVCLAKTATDAIERGLTAQQAADYAIQVLQRRVNGLAGLIVVDRNGEIGFAHSTPHISVAYIVPGEDGAFRIETALSR
jgi:beta-aspartyl-peptidase (threonine type)